MVFRCLRCSAPLPVPEKVEADTIVRCESFEACPTCHGPVGQPCGAKHLIRPGPGGVNVLELYDEKTAPEVPGWNEAERDPAKR